MTRPEGFNGAADRVDVVTSPPGRHHHRDLVSELDDPVTAMGETRRPVTPTYPVEGRTYVRVRFVDKHGAADRIQLVRGQRDCSACN
ncbi:hypothetical protein PROPHIGD43A-5_114 [Mycobacterium phage prophiGD43A-5]|nr:hypothetical protein PROPHIGD43A-5_114 [Mycobacterium phage prophiGD43A-5]